MSYIRFPEPKPDRLHGGLQGRHIAAAYFLAALVTFGHAWHRIGPVPDGWRPGEDSAFNHAFCASVAALAWPAYLSYVAWEPKQ